ncbi:hypothetical protein CPC735_005370 [Coccidioides posadasii C735 delta SOWgp]|uniref:Uncharacterized protein n=1 Tax=Coccidioides posadasii (strain C735) TaxID=222929 RepID=C5P9F3_COCP7|nr:hypothetical protein CPC735_005370 [Coccidioides posadasii C735 delta SOWgp]EER26365.1 hypothetical protein CPC735_005370 [Coccidioides posadasii C735 delta SOWgp]|eukprot:XP_003068510.1 hypothetical protein CPC735_005370 [Coccidioides posadasii C735 delta SOWgp]
MPTPIPSTTSRQALLEKSSNSILPPPNHFNAPNSTMNKPITLPKGTGVPVTSPPAVAGQKRSIDHVDADDAMTHGSFHQATRDQEFYIYEEPSRSIVDLGRETSYLRQSAAVADPRLARREQESQESVGLSSLLNLSQASENNFSITHPTTTRQSTGDSTEPTRSVVPTDPEERRIFIQEKATLLRVRLQAAVKVMDRKQDLDRRLAEFEARYAAQRKYWEETIAQLNKSCEIAAALYKAVPNEKTPKLDPSPSLREGVPMPTMDSSPPSSSASGTPHSQATPKQTASSSHRQSHGLMSPIHLARSDQHGNVIIVDRDINCSVEKMMAKVKRGEALDGLLKLMETTTEYDGLDEWTG